MAKTNLKTDKKVSKYTKDAEFEQLENSAKVACDFIRDVLFPAIEEFEFENDDDNYVSGFVVHGLFVEIIQRLGEMGYTEKDLRKEIKTYLNTSLGQVIH